MVCRRDGWPKRPFVVNGWTCLSRIAKADIIAAMVSSYAVARLRRV